MSPKQSQISWLLGIIGVCLGVTVLTLMFSCLNTAIATIHKDLKQPLANLQWMINIYGIVMASTLVITGRMADLYGRKKLYLIGLALLVISQFGAGFSSKLGWIVCFQAVFGLASGAILPVSQTLLISLFPKQSIGSAVALWAFAVGLALGIGPLIAGVIIQALNWHWIFFINALVAIISLLLTGIFVPKPALVKKKIALDWWGMIFIMLTIAPFTLATVKSGSWPSSYLWAIYGLSAFSLVILLIIEKKVQQPIILEELFTHRRFMLASIGNFCAIFFVWAAFFILPLYLQKIVHYTVLETGLVLLAVSIPLAILSPLVNMWSKKIGQKQFILWGFVCLILASSMFWLLNKMEIELIHILVALIFYGIGWGFIWNPTITAALSSLPSKDTGVGSGTFITIQEVGGIIGLAIVVGVISNQSHFDLGYSRATIVLFCIAMIGFIVTLFLPPTRSTSETSS